MEKMNKKPKKLKASDELEATIRAEYLPSKIMGIVGQILDIEYNAIWRATKAGKEAAKREDNYSPEDLSNVLEKQEQHRKNLRTKTDFLKKLYDKQEMQ